MAVQEKQMGRADLESFLNQQFPNSSKVNDLLEQIVASKNMVEQSLGDEKIPSFYGTISRYISQHTVNGISDWINSDGKVNIAQVNRAAQTAKKVYEIQKQQRQQEEQARAKQEQMANEAESGEKKDAEDKFSKIDFANITEEDIENILSNFGSALADENVPKEVKEILSEVVKKASGMDEFHAIVIRALIDPSILEDPKIRAIIDRHPEKDKYFDEKGLKESEASEYANRIGNVIIQICDKLKPEERTEENIKKLLEENGLGSEKGACDIRSLLENLKNEKSVQLQEIRSQVSELIKKSVTLQEEKAQIPEAGRAIRQEAEQNFQKQFEGQRVHTVDKVVEVASGTKAAEDVGITQDDMEMFFGDLFEGAIDLANQAGLQTREGEEYTTFFEIEEGQQERRQAGIDGQNIDELDGMMRRQYGEVAEMGQQGEEVGRQTAPNAMSVVEMLQSVARDNGDRNEIPNDYTQEQEEAYQSPMLNNLEDENKGGILGFFAKIKEAVQARFAKKPEQKKLNPSSEQRADGWTVTTYDGNGNELIPKTKSFRNVLISFAENTIGKVTRLAANNQRSIENINTPQIIQTNEGQQAENDRSEEKNKWAIDKTMLTPLEHSTKSKDYEQKGDDER